MIYYVVESALGLKPSAANFFATPIMDEVLYEADD